jgi:hypothetical protein
MRETPGVEELTPKLESEVNSLVNLTMVRGRFVALSILSLAACSSEIGDGGFTTGGSAALGGATSGGALTSGGAPATSGGAISSGGASSGGAIVTSGGTTSGGAITTLGGATSGGATSGGATLGGATSSGGVSGAAGFAGSGFSGGSGFGNGGAGGASAGGQGGAMSGGATSGGVTFGGATSGGAAFGGKSSGGASGAGSSSGGSGGDPFGGGSVCTSKTTWKSGNNASMRPGETCIACHTANRGPAFSIAGTVYPTGHEPNDCNGKAGATVIITDAQGKAHNITVNAVGNFYLAGSIPTPYTAKVTTTAGGVRSMLAPQTSGDCNTCHTEKGANGAPGRIVTP